jgi:hypothetical protein
MLMFFIALLGNSMDIYDSEYLVFMVHWGGPIHWNRDYEPLVKY